MTSTTQLYLQKLQDKPDFQKYKSFLWADYIELLCLANIDGQISKIDVFDRLSERERDLKESSFDDLDEMEELEKEENENPTRRSEISDKWEVDLSNWFRVLQYRQALYGNSYPFIITGGEIKRREGEFSTEQKLYLYLLLCSNLFLFDKSTQVELASCFEVVSFNSFKNLIPDSAEAHLFGANPLNISGRYGSGSLWDKINRLSSDLNEVIDPRISQTSIPQTNRGDGGLDLVAWVPTGDALSSSLIYFAQCACTEEWVTKQDSSSHNTWSGKILFKNHISNSIFIPFCFRSSDGTWFKIQDIRLSFLVDRKRLLYYYFQRENISFTSLSAFSVVEEIINARESVF